MTHLDFNASTLLFQMNLSSSKYSFSSDMFQKNKTNQAFYSYNNGVGFVGESLSFAFDFDKNAVLDKKTTDNKHKIEIAKAYIQKIYSDIGKR